MKKQKIKIINNNGFEAWDKFHKYLFCEGCGKELIEEIVPGLFNHKNGMQMKDKKKCCPDFGKDEKEHSCVIWRSTTKRPIMIHEETNKN